MPATQTQNGASAPAETPKVKRAPAVKAPTLAQRATVAKVAKRKPVFKDVPNIPRVPLADGRVGCVQAELILLSDGTVDTGAYMLTIPRRNADGSEAGQRFPLTDIQLLADGFRAAGIQLV